jgi:seryl-tRNA synthetase
MLDINLLRADKGGNPKLVRESLRRRFAKVELVDDIIDLDQAWRTSKNLLSIPYLNPCTSPTGL